MPRRRVERVQTGVRLEKRIVKVLKAVAELHDLTLGDLIEGIALHAFEGKSPFGDSTLATIARLKEIYGLDLEVADSHRLVEEGEGDGEPAPRAEGRAPSRAAAPAASAGRQRRGTARTKK